MSSKKKALVLGGGGSKGSYEVGVCRALDQQKYTFDIVTGTSIGAICGAIYVQGNMEKLTGWIDSFKQDEVASNLFVFPNQYSTPLVAGQNSTAFLEEFCQNGPSIEPLKKKLEEVFDFQKFKDSDMDYACQTFNVTQNKPVAFYKKDMTQDDVLDKILASAAYFPAFNLMKIGDDYYLDGGYAQSVPVDLAIELGAQDLVVVDISDPDEKPPVTPMNGQFLIRPILKLKYYLDFDGEDLSRQVEQGYLEGLKYMSLAPGYLYTFYPEDWEHMVHLEELCMGVMVKAGKISLLEQMDPVMDEIYKFLLGYVPTPLKNKYSERYIFGRILEVMGIIAGVDLYEQIHFKDFIKKILDGFDKFDSNPNEAPHWDMWNAMEQKGLRDFLVFFHSALKSYDGHLPDGFDVFEKKYPLPYYLAWGWYLLEKFELILML